MSTNKLATIPFVSYGSYFGLPLIVQYTFALSTALAPTIEFYNRRPEQIEGHEFITAVWRIKRLKTKPVIDLPLSEMIFN